MSQKCVGDEIKKTGECQKNPKSNNINNAQSKKRVKKCLIAGLFLVRVCRCFRGPVVTKTKKKIQK